MNLEKFTIKAGEALQQAVKEAQRHSQQAIEPEHLFKGITLESDNVMNFLYGKLGVNAENLNRTVEAQIASLPKVTGGEPLLGRATQKVIDTAEQIAQKWVTILSAQKYCCSQYSTPTAK